MTKVWLAKRAFLTNITIITFIFVYGNNEISDDTNRTTNVAMTTVNNISSYTVNSSLRCCDKLLPPQNISGVIPQLIKLSQLQHRLDVEEDRYSSYDNNSLSSESSSSTLSSFLHSVPSSDIPLRSHFKVMKISHDRNMLSQSYVERQQLDLRVGVLLPFSGNRSFVLRKVAPAFERALETVAVEMGPWNFLSLTVLYADSKCDIAEAMNQAIQLQERHKTSAFFGPVCDYALAPVARQARYWNTPVLTVGATAIDYYWYKNTTFSTLTRIGPTNLQGCTEFIESLAVRHGWRKFKVLYDSAGQDDNLVAFCHLLVEYQHHHLMSARSQIVMDYYKLNRGSQNGHNNNDHILRTEVFTDYSGRGPKIAHQVLSNVAHS